MSEPQRPGALRVGQAAGRWVLTASILGSGMALLDATVVNVALPAIGRDLGASLAGLQWTITAYALTLAALILVGGSLGDRLGRRRVFLAGVVWFALSSIACGLAPSIEFLIAARALQGVGGALLTPGSLALIQASFHPDDRARAIGIWSALGGVAGAVGPVVGGWIVEVASFRWVFLLNAPLAVVVIAIGARHLPESADPDASAHFDVAGAVLAVAGLGGVSYALVEAGEPGRRTPVLVAAALGLASLVAFVLVERRSDAPMLPLGMFRVRPFTATNVVTFAVYAALGAVFFFLVIALQVVAGWSPVGAGLALLPITLLMLLLSPSAGAAAQRIGPRGPMTVGPLVAALGVFLLGRIGPHASYARGVLPGVFLLGLGLAATVAPLTATVLASAPASRAGIASGINNAVARTAGLFAVAALPFAVGLSGDDYRDPAAFARGYRAAMDVSAVLLCAGAALAAATIRGRLGAQAGER